ncbi:4Fe-4S dicluster domain-containing protein [Sphingomonas floccifaciens]|uniref:4Fe-4S dicluster domain-containing protein n=1 Tax=Sphingomonas floccifaciens TaxID=1844115 RepID=A0ABW4NDY7_9SPHN
MASPEDLTKVQYFEARRKVFPKAIDGTYRRLKWAIMAATLTIYYVTPWLRWDRGEYAPDQAVLVDIANRRFFMFSIEIWPHEFYYVAGLLVMAGIGLFLVTSSVGRAWCGYACPQTVWTDLFVHVERVIDGDRNAQIKLERAPLGLEKIAKRIVKHAVWLLISVATGGAWIFYFADAPTLLGQVLDGTAPAVAYATIAVLTGTTYMLGAILREQVCVYMCPWPRIQSAMLDERSLMVTYKYWRGEPRTHGLKRAGPAAHQPDGDQAAEPQAGLPSLAMLAASPEKTPRIGDCIDCNACVAVCPTGIDIRNGAQVGCITCALCIDACDQVMAKIGRPPRLIGYSTVEDERIAGEGGEPAPAIKRLLRTRTILYFLVWAGIGLGMLFALGTRSRLDVSVQQTRNPQYVILSDGAVRNAYTVKVRNMENRPRTVEIAVRDLADATMWEESGSRHEAASSIRLRIAADQVGRTRIFVAAPPEGEAREDIEVVVRALDREGGEAIDQSYFERPGASR